MRLLAGPRINDLIGKYVNEGIGDIDVTRTPFVGFGVYTHDGSLLAGVVISNYRGTDCEVSVYAESPTWARKGILRKLFEYIYIQLGCVRCTLIVKGTKDTRRTRRFVEGLGFVLEGNLRCAYDGVNDALVYGLLKRDCRFLKENEGVKGGEEIRAKAASGT